MNNKRTWIEKLSDFISGKGFYLVVLICVAAIALSLSLIHISEPTRR